MGGGTADSVEDTQAPPSHPGSAVVIVWLFVCPPLSQPTLYCETVSRSCGERFTTDMHAGETQKGNAVMIIIVKQSLKGLKRP